MQPQRPPAAQPPGAGPYVVGVDFGTLSGRAVVVRVRDGAELGSAVHEYRARRHGRRARRPPARRCRRTGRCRCRRTSVDVLRDAVPEALAAAGVAAAERRSASAPTSPPARCCRRWPTARRCASCPSCADRPHAYAEAVEAPRGAAAGRPDQRRWPHERGEAWLARYGGKISSEWEFAKGLQLLEEDPEVYDRTDRWIEAADWIVWQLCGVETRNVCTAGYKGIYQDGDYPSQDFLAALNPRFAGFVDDKLRPADGAAGRPGRRADRARPPRWTGLPEGIAVAVGNVDAHVTAAGRAGRASRARWSRSWAPRPATS